jgi:predicted RNA binding protein YcfA (HicA-like mRNA interferase family)
LRGEANLSVREFQVVLKKNGFSRLRQTGSHQVWSDGVRSISFPSCKLKPVIVQRLQKEYNLE